MANILKQHRLHEVIVKIKKTPLSSLLNDIIDQLMRLTLTILLVAVCFFLLFFLLLAPHTVTLPTI